MSLAIDRLQRPFLDEAAIRASRGVMGLDTQLISDGTYFVVEQGGDVVGCGGWSRRATLFGGDHVVSRDDSLLNPSRDPARFRAMYTHPDFVRRGVGRLILHLSEAAAMAEGFARGELAATLAGVPLYRACGWREFERFVSDEVEGCRVPLVRMGKRLEPVATV
jgi:GNAT superfamily N-acetyltransferase